MCKRIAVGLAAALTLSLSVTPIASAKLSSTPSSSLSSSNFNPGNPGNPGVPGNERAQNVEKCEDLIDSAYDHNRFTRNSQSDAVASAALAAARASNVDWESDPEGIGSSITEIRDNHQVLVVRVTHAELKEALEEGELDLGDGSGAGENYLYGIASDYDSQWAYLAVALTYKDLP